MGLLACTLLIASDAFGQIFFLVSVLSIYNVCLALLAPWRLFEMNCVEFVMTLLLVLILLSLFPLTDQTEEINKFESLFSLLFTLILCVGIVYVLRVCFSATSGFKTKFGGWPKPADQSNIVKSLKQFIDYGFSYETLEDMVETLPDYDLFKIQACLDVLEMAGGCVFNFPKVVGGRIYIPNAKLIDETKRTEYISKFKIETRKTESYI